MPRAKWRKMDWLCLFKTKKQADSPSFPEMEDNLDSPAREQRHIENFFLILSQFSYDRAKEYVDKEISKANTSTWSCLLSCLSQLSIAEKTYMGLIFLIPKGFLRKDSSLKSLYENVRTDLLKIEEVGKVAADGSSEQLLAHLCSQLSHFTCARLEMMDFYEKACMMGSGRHMNYEELLAQVNNISMQHQGKFHHPTLSNLQTEFSLECEILMKLLEASLCLQQWLFLPSLLHLYEAHSKLGAWESMIQPKEGRRSGFNHSVLKPNQIPALYQWMWKLKDALISKFSLYFHEILSKQTTHQEMKSLCSKAPIDFYHRLIIFSRKQDAKCIALVLDANSCDYYRGHGYHHPDKYWDIPQGLDSFPAIICYPPVDKHAALWPNIVMIIADRSLELNMDRVICFYDKAMQITYFLIRIEPVMTLVAVFENKKSERDSYITNFLSTFTSQLKGNRIFAGLKPGSK